MSLSPALPVHSIWPGRSLALKELHLTGETGFVAKGKPIAWSPDSSLLRLDTGLVRVPPLSEACGTHPINAVLDIISGDALNLPCLGRGPHVHPLAQELGGCFALSGTHLCCGLPSGKFAVYDISKAHAPVQTHLIGHARVVPHNFGHFTGKCNCSPGELMAKKPLQLC